MATNFVIPMHRRGGSGELDVFDAARYFAGRVDHVGLIGSMEPKLVQEMHDKKAEESRISVPPQHHTKDVKWRAKLAAPLKYSLFSSQARSKKKFKALTSTTTSFIPSCTTTEPKLSFSSSSCESSPSPIIRYAQGYMSRVPYDDLGDQVMRDRRLEGIRVVRGGGDEERWVVKCRAWEEEKFVASGEIEGEEEGGGADGWGSDSSSDLFELEDLSNSNMIMA